MKRYGNVDGYRAGCAAVLLALMTSCQSVAAQPLPPPAFLSDPLGTVPAALNRRVQLWLPSELVDAYAQSGGADPDGLVPVEVDCTGPLDAPLPNDTLSLPDAVVRTVCSHPQAQASWSRIAQQAAQWGQAQSTFWPQLQAGIARHSSRVRYSGLDVPPARTQTTMQNLVLSWRLWDFGARSARVDAAQAQLRAALSEQSAVVQKAVVEILQLYAQAQAAQTRLHTQRQLLPLAQRNVLAAQRRQANGVGSTGDTLQAQAVQARIHLEHSRAEGELQMLLARLAQRVGISAGGQIMLTPEPQSPGMMAAEPEAEPRLLLRPLEEWLDLVKRSHPELDAARAQWQAAQASLEAQRVEHLPAVDVNMGHYRNGRPTQSLSAVRSHETVMGISVSIPLFDGFATTYKVRAAQALVEQKAVELQAVEQQVLQDLVQQYAQAQAALNNARAAVELYRLANAAAQSAQRQYEHGALDIVQLNQSMMQLQQAQQDWATAQWEWNQGRLKLWLYAMRHGTLS